MRNNIAKLAFALTLLFSSMAFATPVVLAQAGAPDGFCTTEPPANLGWVLEGPAPAAPCGDNALYAMSMGNEVTRGTWSVLNAARGETKATLYFEGAGQTAQAQAVTGEEAAKVTESDRIQRLIELDKVYRSQGWQAWLSAAGITCTAAVEARQPEEETVIASDGNHVVVSGLQVRGNCTAPYPAGFTSDRPNEVKTTAQTRQYQPDLRNASVLYTNASFDGQATLWVDLTNWGQLNPPGAAPAATATSVPTQSGAAPTGTPNPTVIPTVVPTQPTPTDTGGSTGGPNPIAEFFGGIWFWIWSAFLWLLGVGGWVVALLLLCCGPILVLALPIWALTRIGRGAAAAATTATGGVSIGAALLALVHRIFGNGGPGLIQLALAGIVGWLGNLSKTATGAASTTTKVASGFFATLWKWVKWPFVVIWRILSGILRFAGGCLVNGVGCFLLLPPFTPIGLLYFGIRWLLRRKKP